MKIKEVLSENRVDEGVWDTIKKVGAGIKGAGQGLVSGNPIQGAKAGMAASAAKSTQQDLINRVAQKAIASWSTQSQNIKASTGNPPTAEDLTKWWQGYSKSSTPIGQNNPIPNNLGNDAAVVKWLNKEVAGYMAKKGATADTASPKDDTKDTTDVEVETPAQGTVTKRDDGKWYNENGQQIVDPKDIAELERRAPAAQDGLAGQTVTIGGQKLNPKDPKDAALIAKLQGQLDQQKAQTQQPATAQQSAGTTLPDPTTATDGDLFAGDTQQAQLDTPNTQPKQHTGGRQKGSLSQTPNAIRKRNARRAAKQSTVQQPSLTDLIKQRQSQGMTEDYADLKTKLKEALSK